MAFITKRKLTRAYNLAVANGKLRPEFDKDAAQIVKSFGDVGFFWPVGVCGNTRAYFAPVRERMDGTIYLSEPHECNPDRQWQAFKPR